MSINGIYSIGCVVVPSLPPHQPCGLTCYCISFNFFSGIKFDASFNIPELHSSFLSSSLSWLLSLYSSLMQKRGKSSSLASPHLSSSGAEDVCPLLVIVFRWFHSREYHHNWEGSVDEKHL